jgi:hypothetical protein
VAARATGDDSGSAKVRFFPWRQCEAREEQRGADWNDSPSVVCSAARAVAVADAPVCTRKSGSLVQPTLSLSPLDSAEGQERSLS